MIGLVIVLIPYSRLVSAVLVLSRSGPTLINGCGI